VAHREAGMKLLHALVESAIISREAAEAVVQRCQEDGGSVVEQLVALGELSEDEALQAMELEAQVPFVRLETTHFDPEAVRLIPEELARRKQIIAISRRDGELTLAMADPLDVMTCDEVQRLTGLRVQRVLAKAVELEAAIQRQYAGGDSLEEALDSVDQHAAGLEAERAARQVERSAEDLSNDSAVARLVQSCIERALQQRASDIHLEPGTAEGVMRIRVDGVLRDILTLSMAAYPAIVSRIKIVAGMDISERRVPQDGRFALQLRGGSVDFRVATLPTILGEKAVLRILDRSRAQVTIDDMGFSSEERQLLEEAIMRPHGFFIVTGPTGSGKTTTLYAILQRLNSRGTNILTCEDPVEYQLDRVNQVQLNTRAGLTFGTFLRSALRQDPDIIMVGEMRDSETAELGVRAALTGHLVLSTLHTNDAAGVPTRLTDMGLAPYLIASTLTGVLSQRLVRRVCPGCSGRITLTAEQVSTRYPKLGLRQEVSCQVARGCRACGSSGYVGRLAVFELLIPDAKLRQLIGEGAEVHTLAAAAEAAGMTPLREAVLRRVWAGQTTLDEAERVIST
jgi:type IV pilus assembly protein PilB